jgi:hypothetical protein
MDYLAYAYLQGAQDKQAEGVLDELNKIRRVDPPNLKVAYAFTAIPARYALERRQWNEAAKLPFASGHYGDVPLAAIPLGRSPHPLRARDWAARTGDTARRVRRFRN